MLLSFISQKHKQPEKKKNRNTRTLLRSRKIKVHMEILCNGISEKTRAKITLKILFTLIKIELKFCSKQRRCSSGRRIYSPSKWEAKLLKTRGYFDFKRTITGICTFYE